MNTAARKLLVLVLTSLGALVVSAGLSADGGYYNELGCGDKWKADGCTVKVDCKTEEDEVLEAFVEIYLDYSGEGYYEAYYEYVEDGTLACLGYEGADLEDAYKTKRVCEGDTEFTFKVDCPAEDD